MFVSMSRRVERMERSTPIGALEFTKRASIFIGLALVPVLVWVLFDVILILVGGVLIAVLLALGAEPLRRLRLPRSLALTLSGFLLISVFGGAAYLFGRGTISELQDVLRRAEQAQSSITTSLQQSQIGNAILAHVQGANVPITDWLSRFFSVSASFLLGCVVTIFIGIYLAAQPALYREGMSKLFPVEWRSRAIDTADSVADALRLWLLGQLIDMLIVGFLSGLAVWLIGLPSPIALGVIAGVADFIPYIGPILAAIPAILVAVTLSFAAVIWTVLAYFLIHQLEGQLIMPLIQQRMIFIPPALMLASIVALSVLFGFEAALFAAPITVVLFVLVKKLYVRETLGEPVQLPGEAA
jgi:predicted PurR-regulated permease PerM